MTLKRPFWFLISASLGCFLAGFVCWMIGNPDFKHPSAFRDWLSSAGLFLILMGDIGLMSSLASCSRDLRSLPRLGRFIIVAVLVSLSSFFVFFLEYGVFNFGDSDLPPYQPDTPFERTFDFLWFTLTIGAGVAWSVGAFYMVMLLSRFFRRQMSERRCRGQ